MSASEEHNKRLQILKEQSQSLSQQLGSRCTKVEFDNAGCPIFWITKDVIVEALEILKSSTTAPYDFLADLTAYDDLSQSESGEGRFVVVYQLLSTKTLTRIRLKARVQENATIPTVSSVFAAANWAEREVYDMFGIVFKDHPDLRRILMDIRWEGHPLRKDYPLRRYQLFNDPEVVPLDLLKE